MDDSQHEVRSDAQARGQRAEAILAELFASARWKVRRQPASSPDERGADLIVQKPGASYVVQVKAAAEGRSDRLIPLWSQACLQAMRVAGGHHAPLAVVAAPRITPRAAEQVLTFAAEYAPDAAAGVIDFAGLRLFRGAHLEGLDARATHSAKAAGDRSDSADLFSDLNQWMLKVLLAPELPDALLSAPRGRYRNASQLARAANVSVMSAFRFVQQLQRDGHLHESGSYLELVRRETLFQRWQAWAAVKRVKEAPMRFLLRGDPQVELGRMLQSGRACLALFAAADALGLGFVHGVPPHVYVSRLGHTNVAAWKNVVPAERGETPDLILREAPAPQSVFRALVRPGDRPTSDAIQVWLDVAAHPARGAEQAEQIRRRVVAPLIEGSRSGG
jgi:hypothetical protein